MSLLQTFQETRQYTEEICAPLETEDYVPQLAVFASPPKWHLAHTTWFFETMILEKFDPTYKVFDTKFSFLFNSYYNTIGDRTLRHQRGHLSRPTVKEIYAYRRYVDHAMGKFLDKNIDSKVHDLIVLGIQHEQQHQELLWTDLKYTFGNNPIHPVYKSDYDDLKTELNETGFVTMKSHKYQIGHAGTHFHFDNETKQHEVYLDSFEVAKALVSNEDYLEFIEDGGYQQFQYWLDEGWSWLQENSIKAPLYWKKIGGLWYQYSLSGLKPIEPKYAVTHISFYEANAFANWKGMRLPTEFEWEAAADQFQWGERWEWTNSAYLPYPGFKTSEGAVGEYNGKFMVNQMVLRGASVATSKNHQRKTYRNFFGPQSQWQYSGIRLAR